MEKVLRDRRLEPELSDFGLRISFGTRISSFGFQVYAGGGEPASTVPHSGDDLIFCGEIHSHV